MENINIKLPKSEIVAFIKSKLTVRDRRDMTKRLFQDVKIVDGETTQITSEAINNSQDDTIKTMIEKFEKKDGTVISESDKILEIALDLEVSDFDILIEGINKVTNTNNETVKK